MALNVQTANGLVEATLTLTVASQPSGSFMVTVTGVNGTPTPYTIAPGSDTNATANNIATAINAHADITATSASNSNTVAIKAVVAGSGGNSITVQAAPEEITGDGSLTGGGVYLDANSYASVATADDYLMPRGRSSWIADATTEAMKEAALINATDYMDRRWGDKLKSTKLNSTQLLEWPRKTYNLPTLIVRACCEYANYALGGDLFANYNDAGTSHSAGTADTSQVVQSQRQRVGPIETETRYQTSSTTTVRRVQGSTTSIIIDAAGRYPLADSIIHQFLSSTSLRGRTIRN